MLSRNRGCTGKEICSFVTGNIGMTWKPDEAYFTIVKMHRKLLEIADENDDGRNVWLENGSCNTLPCRFRNRVKNSGSEVL